MKSINIGGIEIGKAKPCVVVAEIGVNHNGDPDMAVKMIEAAAESGADIVKFQAYTAERLVSPDVEQASHQKGEQSVLELLRSLDLPDESYPRLMACCKERNVGFLCSPFDEERVDFLVRLGVQAFKAGSGELTNYPFLKHMGSKGLPVILSTGMSYLSEAAKALETLNEGGTDDVVMLHCLSSYPGDPAQANLRALHTLEQAFKLPIGFSDHTQGDALAVASRAMGACVLEKHFTLDRQMPGPDQQASMEPGAFKTMIERIRMVESAMGTGRKEPTSGERELRVLARRSLAVARDLPAGSAIAPEDLVALRPGTGIGTDSLDAVVGRKLKSDMKAGAILNWEQLA